jgi:hypothetical protein
MWNLRERMRLYFLFRITDYRYFAQKFAQSKTESYLRLYELYMYKLKDNEDQSDY